MFSGTAYALECFGVVLALASPRIVIRGSGVYACDDMMIGLDLLKTNHGDMWICSMMDVCFYCLLLLPSFFCEAEVYGNELPD